MDDLPTELCTRIFSLACLDDGTTGRMLSLVSKYVHQVSKSVKFQSIVLRGFKQTCQFLAVLQTTPKKHQHVYHLFVHDDYNGDPLYWSDTLKRILHIISPTLRTLAVRSNDLKPSHLHPLDLPLLEELTFFSDQYRAYVRREPIIPLPHLKHIHYAGEFGQYDVDPFKILCEMAPNLTHFRCSEMYSNGTVIGDLETVLGWETDDKQRHEGPGTTFRLPSTITTLVAQAAARQYNGHIFGIHLIPSMMDMLQCLADRGRERGVIIFPPDEECLYHKSGNHMEAEWLDRIHGGQGCWCENNG
jgi:hypothetical protein